MGAIELRGLIQAVRPGHGGRRHVGAVLEASSFHPGRVLCAYVAAFAALGTRFVVRRDVT